MLHKNFQSIENEGKLANSFYEASVTFLYKFDRKGVKN